MPRLPAFARHVEADTIKVQKPMSATLSGKPDTARYHRYSGEFGEGTRLAMPKTICAPDIGVKTGGSRVGGPNLCI